jgi:hypothetical protein
VLQWAVANGCPWDEHTCASAAEEGHQQATINCTCSRGYERQIEPEENKDRLRAHCADTLLGGGNLVKTHASKPTRNICLQLVAPG